MSAVSRLSCRLAHTTAPVLMILHGGGGSAAGHMDHSATTQAADALGFIAVLPNGWHPLFAEKLLTWNAGACRERLVARLLPTAAPRGAHRSSIVRSTGQVRPIGQEEHRRRRLPGARHRPVPRHVPAHRPPPRLRRWPLERRHDGVPARCIGRGFQAHCGHRSRGRLRVSAADALSADTRRARAAHPQRGALCSRPCERP